MLPADVEKIIKVKPFQGIPNALDYIPYSKIYYSLVENRIKEAVGEHANLLQATRIMNLHGNIIFFDWFPDMYNVSQEELTRYYRPRFQIVAGNPYADYLHGLTHIRSRSEHTNMGEALVIPDNLYNVGVRYQKFMATNKGLKIVECTKSPYEEYELSKMPINHMKLFLMNIRFDTFKYQDHDMTIYKPIYRKEVFKSDFPKERVSEQFITFPQNYFETRLSQNTIRTIFLDQKFKQFSSQQKSFIETPISTSSQENYKLIFSTEEEDHWIDSLYKKLTHKNYKIKLQEIVNTSHTKDSYPQKLAAASASIILSLLE